MSRTKNWRPLLYLLLAWAVFGIILSLPTAALTAKSGDGTPVHLSNQGKASLAVLALAVILWMTEVLPFPVTGLLALVTLGFTRAVGFREIVKEGFGNEIVLFFIGVLVFSAMINRSGLLRRLTVALLSRTDHSPKALLFTFLAVGALLSMWITDMAVAAILMPLGAGILRHAGIRRLESNFGRALMIACAWGPLIGGVATPAGCGPNPLTIGYLRDLAGINFTFGQWMLLGVPAMLMMLPCAWLTLLRCFPIEPLDLKAASTEVRGREGSPGRASRREWLAMGIMGLAIALWLLRPLLDRWTNGATGFMSISFVAIACACLCFLPRIEVITWKEAEQDIDWGGIILVMSGLSLGMAVYRTGAAEWLAVLGFSKLGLVHPIGQVFLVVFGVALLKVAFSSNTVTGVIVVPLMIALSKQLGIQPGLLAIPAGITASLAFILVTSTPTNVIPYAAGYFTIRDMARAGIWMTLWASICVTISIALFGKFSGLRIFG